MEMSVLSTCSSPPHSCLELGENRDEDKRPCCAKLLTPLNCAETQIWDSTHRSWGSTALTCLSLPTIHPSGTFLGCRASQTCGCPTSCADSNSILSCLSHTAVLSGHMAVPVLVMSTECSALHLPHFLLAQFSKLPGLRGRLLFSFPAHHGPHQGLAGLRGAWQIWGISLRPQT